MAQFGYPIADNSFALLGGYSVNSAGNRYQNLDDNSDSDYVYSQNNPGGASNAEFQLTSLTDPVSSSNHILRIRHAQIDEDGGAHPRPPDATGTATTLAWELREGATIRASGSVSPAPGDPWATYAYTLSGAEADSITDYTNLRAYISPGGGGGAAANRRAVAVSWIELEIPDAPAPSTTSPHLLTLGVG